MSSVPPVSIDQAIPPSHPLDREGLTADQIFDISEKISVLPVPQMQLFRASDDTIRAGPPKDRSALAGPSTYDPALNLDGLWAQDSTSWVPLEVADLTFDDIVPAAQSILQENNRIGVLSNPSIAELNSIGTGPQNLSKATRLKLSIIRPSAYRLTSERLLIPMIAQTQRTSPWISHTGQTNSSEADRSMKQEVGRRIAAIHDTAAVSLGGTALNYDRVFTELDTDMFGLATASSGGNLEAVLTDMVQSRGVVGEYFPRHALCKDPHLMSRSHTPHENLLRTTQEEISPSDYTKDAAIQSDVQRFRHNKLLTDGICGGWRVDASQADVSLPSTEALFKTVEYKSELERERQRARNKRRNANRKAQKAQETAITGKHEDSRDSDRTVGGSRTPPSAPAPIVTEVVGGDSDLCTGGRAPPSSPVFDSPAESALYQSG
jgi:hypothetical protein